jgi:hypothetical protein
MAARSGALDLKDIAEQSWPLTAFLRDDAVLFGAYVDALRRLVTSPTSIFGNLTALDRFIDHYDALLGEEQAAETYPYSTLAQNAANSYRADVDALRSTVAARRADVVAFLNSVATTTTQTTTATHAASMSATTALVPSILAIFASLVSL